MLRKIHLLIQIVICIFIHTGKHIHVLSAKIFCPEARERWKLLPLEAFWQRFKWEYRGQWGGQEICQCCTDGKSMRQMKFLLPPSFSSHMLSLGWRLREWNNVSETKLRFAYWIGENSFFLPIKKSWHGTSMFSSYWIFHKTAQQFEVYYRRLQELTDAHAGCVQKPGLKQSELSCMPIYLRC